MTGIYQRARSFPCRRKSGGCGAKPGELCIKKDGGKTYNVHLDRLKQENEEWHREHSV